MASKRDQFLTACRASKLDTVRWGLGAGGQTPGTRDDDGFTAIMITASLNKHKALQMLLDNCRRARIREPIDFVDGRGDEETALMMAARAGHAESCDELLYAGANVKLKCARGMTAADHARANGHDALARRIDRGGDSSEEEEESEDEEDVAFEGETSTQRSKRKKKELEALERRGDKNAGKGKTDDDDADEDAHSGEAPEPKWPETLKAKEAEAKEVFIERAKGDVDVDPALFHLKSVNNLRLKLGVSLTRLSPDVSRLSGLLTLIISGNGLTELPESIGKLKNLKVLEAENNHLTTLPASLAQCDNLEILRVSQNGIKSLAPLEHANNLVTLVVDNNKLTTLDDFNVEAKERLVTLSARMNQIVDAPADIHQCTLLAEIFLKSNKIEELPGEWGELKEKKVREIELDGNPIADPKIRKMMDKSANFVKELLTYLRKNGKKSAGKKKKAPAAPAADSDDDEPAPAVAPAKASTAQEAPSQGEHDKDGDASETEEELEARMAKMNKKEREKFKRKLAEERQAKAAKEAERKRREADAAADARLQAAKSMHEAEDVEGDSDIDSDDEMALLARKKGKKPAGFLYAMTDEQRAVAEKAEAERLYQVQLAKEREEEAKKATEARAALELAAKVQGVKLTGDGVYGWEYTGGQFKSCRVPALPKGAKGPCVELEIPKIIVGKLIGQKGMTIKGVQDRSKAMVSIDETKGGSGNSLLRVRGDESAMESARMLMNNALSGKR